MKRTPLSVQLASSFIALIWMVAAVITTVVISPIILAEVFIKLHSWRSNKWRSS